MEQTKMTKEEVQEKFKDVKIKFTHYYKYSFTFEGMSEDGYKIVCSYGGNTDDIYRFNVTDQPVNVGIISDWVNVLVYYNDEELFFINNGW